LQSQIFRPASAGFEKGRHCLLAHGVWDLIFYWDCRNVISPGSQALRPISQGDFYFLTPHHDRNKFSHTRHARHSSFSRDYAALTAEVDISRVSERRRDPGKVARLLQSLARNISTEAPVATLAADVRGGGGAFKDETAADYLDALERLMITEDLPAWRAHIRSSATLRRMPKRHFADPSLACGILRLDAGKLLADLSYFGLLFESLVIRDLRIYAQANDAAVWHCRDSAGCEVDAIVEAANGDWLAVEVKLGVGAADGAAQSLLKFAANIDTSKTPAPRALVVVTANGFAHRRADGVCVVPLATLAA
jgi:predicted AAA+ superfamily ATPase